MPSSLKELDKKVINVLLSHGRLSMRQVAKKVGVSVATIMHRMKALEQEGIITNYAARLNYEKAGYDFEVIIQLRIKKGKLLTVEKKLSLHPNVFYVYDTTGEYDTFVIARFPTRRRLDSFLKKLQQNEYVDRIETRLILNTMKENMSVEGL